jgi:hypothetical protein
VAGIQNLNLKNQLSLNTFGKNFFKNKLHNTGGDNLLQL